MYATLNSSWIQGGIRSWTSLCHWCYQALKIEKINIDKSLKKNLAPYICKVIKKYAYTKKYKNNKLILLFSLIYEMAILPHLSGNVWMSIIYLTNSGNIVYQSKIVLSENTIFFSIVYSRPLAKTIMLQIYTIKFVFLGR